MIISEFQMCINLFLKTELLLFDHITGFKIENQQ